MAGDRGQGRATVTDADARKVAFGAFVGTALEWYDFFLYGTAAALVFNRLYFATDDVVVSTLAAFASFAVGFAARPLGAVIFGHLGDRIGRKRCLIITVTMKQRCSSNTTWSGKPSIAARPNYDSSLACSITKFAS